MHVVFVRGAQKIRLHLSYRCGAGNGAPRPLYRDAHNIPHGVCAGTWRFKGQLSLSLPVDAPEIIAELMSDGYVILRLPEALIILP